MLYPTIIGSKVNHMKTSRTIRSATLTTLLAFVIAAIGLQPLFFNSDNGCDCAFGIAANVLIDDEASSCCSSSSDQTEQSSCCTNQAIKKRCCNPDASVCGCGDGCQCSENSNSLPIDPGVPANETTEVVSVTLVCSAPFSGFPKSCQTQQTCYPTSAATHAALTSQQTCVLLSRFTC